MANLPVLLTLTWTDFLGRTARTRFNASSDSPANTAALVTTLATELQELTNCILNGITGQNGELHFTGRLGSSGVYSNAEDKAVMTYVDAFGDIHRYQIPGPKSSLFLADGVTIDQANVEVVDFNSVMLNAAANAFFISSRSEQPIQAFLGGLFIRRKKQRRENIVWRNPTDTGPAE